MDIDRSFKYDIRYNIFDLYMKSKAMDELAYETDHTSDTDVYPYQGNLYLRIMNYSDYCCNYFDGGSSYCYLHGPHDEYPL